MEVHSILFYNDEDVGKYQIDAIRFIDSEAMYITFGSGKSLVICSLKFNSIVIEAHCRKVQEYENNWERVTKITIMNMQLIISHSIGALPMNLESHSVSQILSSRYKPKFLATYNDEILLRTSEKCVKFWKSSGIEVFAGREEEEGSRNGTVDFNFVLMDGKVVYPP